jgi:hypothetical protein
MNLETGNEQASIDGLSQSYEGSAATVIRGATIESLVMATQRMSDPGNSDKLTIAKTGQLMQGPATRSQVEARGDDTSTALFLDAAKTMEANAALKRLRKVCAISQTPILSDQKGKSLLWGCGRGIGGGFSVLPIC